MSYKLAGVIWNNDGTMATKKLTPLEALDKIAYSYGYDENVKIIETALKNYQELLKRPCVLVGRTNGHTKALIDTICKNYKEVKITNLEDEKKLKALDIIQRKRVNLEDLDDAIYEDSYHEDNEHNAIDIYNQNRFEYKHLTQEEFDLLKEVLL